jgi:hypothetical protein
MGVIFIIICIIRIIIEILQLIPIINTEITGNFKHTELIVERGFIIIETFWMILIFGVLI